MPSHYDNPFDHHNTEDAAGKKKKPGIKTHDNFGLKDMPLWYQENYRNMIKEHNKKKNKKKNGK